MDSEKAIEQTILKWLNLQFNCFAFKQDVKGTWDPTRKCFRKVGKYVPKGGSDILICFKGRFISLEVKTPEAHKKFYTSKNEHELRQQSYLQRVRSAGGLSYVVSSLSQVQELFTQWLTL